MIDTVVTRNLGLILPSRPKQSEAQAKAEALVSSFIHHATDGYSLAAMVGGGLVYRLGKAGTLALGSRLLTPYSLPLTSSLLHLTSIGVGFTGEVFTFEAGQRALRVEIGGADPEVLRWGGENGLGVGLAGAALTLGPLKGAGVFTQGQNPVLQHLFQDSAMVLAHNTAGAIGIAPRPNESLAEQLVNAEATLWQMNAGMSLVHGAAPGLGQVERSLDLSIRSQVEANLVFARNNGRSQGSPLHSLEPLLALATSVDPSTVAAAFEKPTFSSVSLMTFKDGEAMGSSRPSLSRPFPSDAEKAAITERYWDRFPQPRRQIFTREIFRDTFRISSPLPSFHERVIEVLAEMPNRGTMDQYKQVIVLRQLFHFNGLRTGLGSFNNLCLQWLVEQVVADPNSSRRVTNFRNIFSEMSSGISQSRLAQIHQALKEQGVIEDNLRTSTAPEYSEPFYRRNIHQVAAEWEGYGHSDQVQLFNHIEERAGGKVEIEKKLIRLVGEGRSSDRYEAEAIDTALAFARNHPFGKLILERILHIFITEDHPAFLRELRADPEDETFQYVKTLEEEGTPRDDMVNALVGTRHNGYLSDSRLTHKLIGVAQDSLPYLKIDPLQNPRRDVLEDALLKFLHSGGGRVLEAEVHSPEELLQIGWNEEGRKERFKGAAALLEILNANPSPRAERLRAFWEAGEFEIVVVSPSVYRHFAENGEGWKNSEIIDGPLFLGRHPRAPDLFIVPEQAPADMNRLEELSRLYTDVLYLVEGVPHEAEHMFQHQGIFEGFEGASSPMNLKAFDKDVRLTSEAMAFLEEYRWRVQNYDNHNFILARQMGDNLPTFFRDLADSTYFGKTKRRLIEEFFRFP